METALAAEIAAGILSSGSRLPTEDQLIERFAVSRTTVRKAVENLVSRGLVEIRRGKGTFVTEPKLTQALTSLSGFVEDMTALGRQATARLLDKRPVPATQRWRASWKWLRARWSTASSGCGWRTARPCRSMRPTAPNIGEKVASNDLEAEPIFRLRWNCATSCR